MVGELLAQMYRDEFSGDVLPDGRMYWNIANKVVKEPLENNYKLAVEASMKAVEAQNKAKDIGQKVVRSISGSDTCDWCKCVAVSYAYSKVKNGHDVWRRHLDCDCLIEFVSSKGREVVRNYKKSSRRRADRGIIEERKSIQGINEENVNDVEDTDEIVHRRIGVEYARKIRKGKQDIHIRGTNNFIESKSELIVDPQMLVDLYFGKGYPIIVNGKWVKKEVFVHDDVIGIWRSWNGTQELETCRGIMHYSKTRGVHIVPAHPEGELQ